MTGTSLFNHLELVLIQLREKLVGGQVTFEPKLFAIDRAGQLDGMVAQNGGELRLPQDLKKGPQIIEVLEKPQGAYERRSGSCGQFQRPIGLPGDRSFIAWDQIVGHIFASPREHRFERHGRSV